MYKIKCFGDLKSSHLTTYEFHSYEELKVWVDERLETFKRVNRVTNEERDMAFLRYKEEMQKHLMNMQKVDKGQVMDDYLKCNKCLESEHDNWACRCEDRNIRVAKERRARGEIPWQKSQPERLNP